MPRKTRIGSYSAAFVPAILPAILLAVLLGAGGAYSQTAQLSLGGMRADPTLPVEMTSDSLTIDQADGTAVFAGNVVVAQGEMRLAAAEVRVEYAMDSTGAQTGIRRLLASGGVTLATSAEAAEAREAVYTVADGLVELSGDVLLTQGGNTISGESMRLDLRAGTGTVNGRVRTVLTPAGGGN